jgi:(E)-4-hydroxy-3-methylbut-2-enyl-diphosphate synthase
MTTQSIRQLTPPFTVDPWVGRRRSTRAVQVGDVGVGGANPIRIQSMTNTDTMDTRGTVDQIERMAAAGCEIARVTAPSIREAEHLREIRAELDRRCIRIPLVADIHFTPNAAMIAAECVEKVRINPGNYADKKKFEVREYGDAEYAEELERVATRFSPLVRRCKANGVAMRIGTNHGSLSDRIMNRYGDSPLGMVESALEFLDVCEAEGYREIIFSMKASNTHVAIHAYRLLAARLEARAPGVPSYPFHLGVTEAGDSEDGRIKSAIGIGALLEDGIGDTIRVSLTEDPVREVPVARRIALRAESRWREDEGVASIPIGCAPIASPYEHVRRPSQVVDQSSLLFGGDEPIRVELDLGMRFDDTPVVAAAQALARSLAAVRGVQCESFAVEASDEDALAAIPDLREALDAVGLGQPLALRIGAGLLDASLAVPIGASRLIVSVDARTGFSTLLNAIRVAALAHVPVEWRLCAEPAGLAHQLERVAEAERESESVPFAYSVASRRAPHAARLLAAWLTARVGGDVPIILRHELPDGSVGVDPEAALIAASIDLGSPLCDGIGDLVSLGVGVADPGVALDLAYRILQGARLRTTRTEYISCPSCGRTLFDLEETTARIKAATDHLTGVKIAIMGCIVNGPGEMADADFGYVGSGQGKITLYAGKNIVARNVPEADATVRLLDLIEAQGRRRAADE